MKRHMSTSFKKIAFKYTALFALMTICMYSAYAGTVRDDIDYQQFRDFAENKGKFAVGATNIEIKDKVGNVVETLFTEDIAMPDWSAVNKEGYATLIDPQYIVSVAHNHSYDTVQFGSNDSQNPDNEKFEYRLVERYKFGETDKKTEKETADYHQPRLHKLVTEVVPIDVVKDQKTLLTEEDLKDFKKRYPLLVRIGSGIQEVQSIGDDSITKIMNNYVYLTGGKALNIAVSYAPQDYIANLVTDGALTDDDVSKMAIIQTGGDSGSPIYVYDNQDKKWKFIATHTGDIVWSDGKKFYYSPINKDEYNKQKQEQDIAGTINTTAQTLTWTPDGQNGTSLITGGNGSLSVNLFNPTLEERVTDQNNQHPHRPQEKHGKTFTINGDNNTLHLTDNINQGAGAIYFNGNTTVTGADDTTTWLGAGVSVAKDKSVTWKIKNPENDRLSKIGGGTLLVNGTGDNQGDISVGDGLVILNQQGGHAFNKVGIVSGRPTVKLESSNQVNPDNIYFGYRGGRLDVNGNDLEFNYIKNIDDGARIVNHNTSQSATITIKTNATDPNKSAFNGVFGELDETKNGQLNVVYNPDSPQNDKTFLLSGGANLNGNLTVEKGSLLLSGRPTPHAYDHLKDFEPFKDDDWQNRTFNATNIIANNDSTLTIGRNVKDVTANIIANNTAKVHLGFVNNSSVCVRSDYDGKTECKTQNYNETVLKTIPTTKIVGDLTLNNTANITIGGADVMGKSIANKDSRVILTENARWTMTDSGTLGNLVMNEGSQITLNENYENGNTNQFNTLIIQGDLSGNGQFHYLTNIAENKGDKVVVDGVASGNHILSVKDNGAEPTNSQDLVLLTATNRDNLTVQLQNATNANQNFVDLGAWRYELADKNNDFVLVGKQTVSTTPVQPPSNPTQPNNPTNPNPNPPNNPITPNNPTPTNPTTPTPVVPTPSANTISKYTNVALSAKYAQLNNAFSATNGITAHLWNAPKYKGIWATVERDDRTVTSPLFRNYDSEHTLTQLGIDETVDVRQGQLLVGTALSYGKGVQTFGDGKGESELLIGSAYGKWTSPKNAFVSFDLGFGQGTQQLTLTDKVKPKHTFAHLGLGVGKTWQAGNFTATPSLAVRQYHFGGDRYAMDGANIAYDKANILSYQPSIRLGYQLNTQSGLTLRPYLASTYTHTDDKAKVQVNTHQFVVPFANTWQHKVGLEAQKGKLYGQLYASQEQGDHIKDGQKIGLSVGYGW